MPFQKEGPSVERKSMHFAWPARHEKGKDPRFFRF